MASFWLVIGYRRNPWNNVHLLDRTEDKGCKLFRNWHVVTQHKTAISVVMIRYFKTLIFGAPGKNGGKKSETLRLEIKSAVHVQARYRCYVFFVLLGPITGWRVGNTKIGEAVVALWITDSQNEVGTSKCVEKCGNKMPTRCNRWYLLQIILLAQHVSGTIMPIIRGSRVLYRWSLPLVFGFQVVGHITLSSTPYRQLENQSTKYQRQRQSV